MYIYIYTRNCLNFRIFPDLEQPGRRAQEIVVLVSWGFEDLLRMDASPKMNNSQDLYIYIPAPWSIWVIYIWHIGITTSIENGPTCLRQTLYYFWAFALQSSQRRVLLGASAIYEAVHFAAPIGNMFAPSGLFFGTNLSFDPRREKLLILFESASRQCVAALGERSRKADSGYTSSNVTTVFSHLVVHLMTRNLNVRQSQGRSSFYRLTRGSVTTSLPPNPPMHCCSIHVPMGKTSLCTGRLPAEWATAYPHQICVSMCLPKQGSPISPMVHHSSIKPNFRCTQSWQGVTTTLSALVFKIRLCADGSAAPTK